jgi:CTP synthase (UTP-ammonia lyase)
MAAKVLFLIGERDVSKKAHLAIEASVDLLRRTTGRDLPFKWVRSDSFDAPSGEDSLAEAGAIWCTPGSPYASTAGAISAVKYARTRGVPFLGTCGGFQHALMEYAENVLHHSAVHQELDPEADSPLIAKLSCSLVGVRSKVIAEVGSKYAQLLGSEVSEEEFNCNYGVAPKFKGLFERTELELVAFDEAGQPRVFWHRDHPFFVGTLFQPERRSFSGMIHPLVHALLEWT